MRTHISRLALSLAPFLAVLGSIGCGSSEVQSEVDKAGKVTQLRKDAKVAFDRFQASGDDPKGVDVDSLIRYVELHGETTKLLPGTCPSCYSNYAAGLARLGLYYDTLVRAFEQEQKQASPAEKRTLQTKIDTYRKSMLDAFANSSRQFENYFRTAASNSELVDPEAYRWLVRVNEYLKDYNKCLYYLDMYAASVTLPEEGKRNVQRLKDQYRREIEKQEEDRLRSELKGES